ncbi:hypothetical protein FOF61_06585 [Lactobacillus jensenii]|uniref:hypothetical protein n=1 Tax=Lactobacillus TaxID=1578 RepID=UPI001190D1E2|nr:MULTISPECIES: hypothetical protein [Lactobacillus]MCF1843703.1 hypothetical protein [Lactobacillus jensenii]MCZ9642014.1 hypothetical protein [Lactobacillus jensenii]MCZ9649893.1 hypothetical protein [Lactobacillus mulieris]MCZ9655612.1 hypothetical protein [Lactobacillus iners]MCZ9656540.1 hypothetical protein [Lactobacillus jensenii]
MFWSSRKSFRLFYYVSSLLPVYLFMLIFMIIIKIENQKAFLYHEKLYKIIFGLFIFCIFASVYCLLKTKSIIKRTTHFSKTYGTTKVILSDNYNIGFREFILSFILPLISTFSIDEYPIATISMIFLFQLLMYIFFISSSDFFPNIPLVLLGFSVFEVKTTNSENSKLKYVFGKTKNIAEIMKDDKSYEVVEIGEPNYFNNIGVICE